MPVIIKSSEVQQNFGRVMDKALMEDDVIVERYGKARIAILSYQRYQDLLQAEKALANVYFVQPDHSSEAQQWGQSLAEQVRQELQDSLDASLEEVMTSMRGRAWS